MNAAEALVRLGERAASALVAALAELGGDDVEQGAIRAVDEAGSAFDGFELPVQSATVAGGEGGRTTFVLTQPGAARLAAATAAEGQSAGIGAIGETLGKLSAAAASAVATALGSNAEPPAPRTRLVAEPDPPDAWETGASVAVVSLTVCGEPAALVLVVPAELLGRVDAAGPGAVDADVEACGAEGAIAGESLREVKVRLWAELGRTRMALGRAVGLAPGEVVELDAAVDDPVIIFVNGVRLGSGHLVVGDDGEWAFRVVEVSAVSAVHRQLERAAAPQPETATVEGKEA
jgi:flagellar motor switch protein FliN/FliY